jgi:hypothetical protein
MATPAQIRNRAATMLGILGEGETLPSYESNDMTESYSEVYAQLSAKNMAVWDLADDVPAEYAPHVVSLVAAGRMDDYSIPNDKYSRIAATASQAYLEIKELQSEDTYVTPTPDYF